MSRYGVGVMTARFDIGGWPVGTFAANLLGCLVLGVVMEALELREWVSREMGLAITVGFLGAFTTFSTFGHETVRLMERGQGLLAVAYVTASVLAGCALCFLGIKCARAFWGT